MSGRLSFIEIATPDLKVASKFLGQLFDWPFTPMGEAGEGWFQTPGMRAGMHQEAKPKFYVFQWASVLSLAACGALSVRDLPIEHIACAGSGHTISL